MTTNRPHGVIDLAAYKTQRADRETADLLRQFDEVMGRLQRGEQRCPDGQPVAFTRPVRVAALSLSDGTTLPPIADLVFIHSDSAIGSAVLGAWNACALRYGSGPTTIILGRRSWLQFCIAIDDFGSHKQYRGAILICDPTREDWVQALPPAHLVLDEQAHEPMLTRGP